MTYFNSDFANGLLETTDADRAMMDELMACAVPFSDIARNRDDEKKVIAWDLSLERFLLHRAKLIFNEGVENFLPWNLYKILDIDWEDGLFYPQRSGDCCSFGARNSLNFSNLVAAYLRNDGTRPPEIAQSMCYALARGKGKPKFGSGLNLNPMAHYSATLGNFHTADFGRYDTGHYCTKYRGGEQDVHAKSSQSIIIPLPKCDFDLCYLLCAAGLGINIGSGVYPGGANVGSDGLASEILWSSGGHSVALVAACTVSGKRYLYLVNSHGAKYAPDRFNAQKQWGCWIDEVAFEKLRRGCNGDSMKYGIWYGNAGEL
jgi:hypothetical protein